MSQLYKEVIILFLRLSMTESELKLFNSQSEFEFQIRFNEASRKLRRDKYQTLLLIFYFNFSGFELWALWAYEFVLICDDFMPSIQSEPS